ncbi:MAG TPA: hypothetical protein VM325_07555 [Alphaproteobacteria bacterium]|nr:hypothetical protein [Alphaproteobacteria bacterium]
MGVLMLSLAAMILAMHLWTTRGSARANVAPQATFHERYGVTPKTFANVKVKPARLARAVKPARERWCLIQLAYHEARSESDDSIVKRIWTAVWRSRRDDFKANTICEAVFAYGAFSAFLKGIPPMHNKAALARVTRIVDEQMPAILPDSYGGRKCMDRDIYTDRCVFTLADTVKVQPVMTHHAETDCRYLGLKGYNYVRRNGRCEPRWARKMVEVAAVRCTMIKNRPCVTVFWVKDSDG